MKAKLRDVIDAIDFQIDGSASYFNTRTCEVVTLSEEDMSYADDDYPLEDEPEWVLDMAKVAKDVLESDDYIELPSQWDVDEYRIMEDFCLTQTSGDTQHQLLRAIKGRGAFRRFKDTAFDTGVIDEWYTYKDRRFEEIAIDWCKMHNIDYE